MASLMELIKAKGFEVSKQKTLLWEEVETIATGVTKESFDFYISATYEGSAFIIVRDGDETRLVNLWRDEINTANYETINDKGLVDSKYVDFTVTIKMVKALRDDNDFKKPIKKGDLELKAFVD